MSSSFPTTAGSTPALSSPAAGVPTAPAGPHARALALWLALVALLVFAMVVLGGVTRLTGSGLSMTDWQPVSGSLPPMSEEAWAEEFARYQTSPEFKHVNFWMDVDDFKRIFWFEFGHRLLGRFIGLAFALPFLYFLVRRQIPRAFASRLVLAFVLGGLQGLLGWYMVKSGLVDEPRVSHYRLAAHLSLAVLIYGYLVWLVLGLVYPARAVRGGLGRVAAVVTGAVLLTLVSGAFVAGLRAGLVYNTFPLMGERLIPDGLLAMQPLYLNVFENVTTVQFNHRLLAMATFAAVLSLAWTVWRRRGPGPARRWAAFAAAAVLVQVGLGITTLLLQVPVAAAAAHQAGAMVLVTALLGTTYHLSRAPARPGAPSTSTRRW